MSSARKRKHKELLSSKLTDDTDDLERFVNQQLELSCQASVKEYGRCWMMICQDCMSSFEGITVDVIREMTMYVFSMMDWFMLLASPWTSLLVIKDQWWKEDDDRADAGQSLIERWLTHTILVYVEQPIFRSLMDPILNHLHTQNMNKRTMTVADVMDLNQHHFQHHIQEWSVMLAGDDAEADDDEVVTVTQTMVNRLIRLRCKQYPYERTHKYRWEKDALQIIRNLVYRYLCTQPLRFSWQCDDLAPRNPAGDSHVSVKADTFGGACQIKTSNQRSTNVTTDFAFNFDAIKAPLLELAKQLPDLYTKLFQLIQQTISKHAFDKLLKMILKESIQQCYVHPVTWNMIWRKGGCYLHDMELSDLLDVSDAVHASDRTLIKRLRTTPIPWDTIVLANVHQLTLCSDKAGNTFDNLRDEAGCGKMGIPVEEFVWRIQSPSGSSVDMGPSNVVARGITLRQLTEGVYRLKTVKYGYHDEELEQVILFPPQSLLVQFSYT